MWPSGSHLQSLCNKGLEGLGVNALESGELLLLLDAALLLVVVVQIAILAFALRVGGSVGVRAGIDLEVAAILVIAVVAHALSVVLLVLVRTPYHFH